MFEDRIDVLLLGDVPDRLAELAGLGHVGVVLGRIDLRQLAPAIKVLAVDDALGAERHHVLALRFVRDHADRVCAGGRAELDPEHAQSPRGAPDQHVVARLQPMRLVAEQHAIGRGERQRIGGRLLPGQVLWAGHQLPVLHAAELSERAVGRLVAPDTLGGGEHRVAAVAFLVVAVVLVAVDHDLVADLPTLDLGADRPDDSGRVGAGDVIGVLVDVEGGDGLAERRPDAVVIHSGRHHQDQHVVAVEGPCRHDLDLHGLLGRSMPVLAHDPGIHRRGHVTHRRNLADFVEILFQRRGMRLGAHRVSIHGSLRVPRCARELEGLPYCGAQLTIAP